MAESGKVIQVGELIRLVRRSLEQGFPLQWIGGEISNLTRAASGHIYFSLKDETAQARCVMFRSRAQAIPWHLENGQQVEVRALVSLYEPRGDFQLSVEGIRRAGLGKMFEAFARLKARLEAEGLFSTVRKQSIPRFPRTIGIVSSPQAAALQDVIVTILRRAPHVATILYPTLVQGDSAAIAISQAIAVARDRDECDVLLIVRGGGGIEDLWSFNEESVARAMQACPMPTISGVGHETDLTIVDLVADLRAATPTAAAEIATQGWHEATGKLEVLGRSLQRATERALDSALQAVDRISLRLAHPSTRLSRSRDMLVLLAARLKNRLPEMFGQHHVKLNIASLALTRAVPKIETKAVELRLLLQRLGANQNRQHVNRQHLLNGFAAALHHLNPEMTLARGFAIVRDADGNVVSDASRLAGGQIVNLKLAQGDADASISVTRPGNQACIAPLHET